jgi:WD40 repeat protein
LHTLETLPAYLAEANQIERLHEILTTFDFLQVKLDEPSMGIQALIEDYRLPDAAEFHLMQSAFMNASFVLSLDPQQLATQIIGRLLSHQSKPAIAKLLADIKPVYAWIRPLTPSHTPAGSALQRTFSGHRHTVCAIVVTTDGRYALSGSYDFTVKMWDIRSGATLHTLRGHEQPVNSIAVTTDGKHAISASSDHTLKVWDLLHGIELRTLQGHENGVRTVLLTPDEAWAISASSDHTIRLWDWKQGNSAEIFIQQDHGFWTIALTPDGHHLASIQNDTSITLWDMKTGQPSKVLATVTPVIALTISPDGKYLAAGCEDGTLILWDLTTQELFTTPAHVSEIWTIAFTPNVEILITGSEDGTLKLWAIKTLTPLQTVNLHVFPVLCTAVTPDGKQVLSGSYDQTVRLWTLDLDQALKSNPHGGHTASVSAVAWFPHQRQIISGSLDHTLKVWAFETGEELHSVTAHADQILDVTLTPDGKYAISASSDTTLAVWDTTTWEKQQILSAHRHPVEKVMISFDGKYLISNCSEGQIMIWQRGKLWRRNQWYQQTILKARGKVLALHPQEYTIVVYQGRSVEFWDIRRGIKMGSTQNDQLIACAFQPELSACLAYGIRLHSEGLLIGYGFEGIRSGNYLVGHNSNVNYCVFSPDGLYLASISSDYTLKIWDWLEQRCLYTFTGDVILNNCQWSQDNRHIVAGNVAGRVLLLRIEEDSSHLSTISYA